MALIHETGEGLSNAESYISVADADEYFTKHGSPDEWTSASTSQKEGSLRYATMWLDDTFLWYSSLYSTTQALGFPRVSWIDESGRTIGGAGVIPQKVKDATCEMALNWLKEDFTSTGHEGVLSEQVGWTRIEYTKTTKSFSFVKLMLKGYGSPSKANSHTIYRC